MRNVAYKLVAIVKNRPYLSALIAIVFLIRVTLPLVVERVVETTAAEALGLSIELDDVDLGLLRGVLAADGLKIAPPEARRDEEGHLAADDVLVGWERLCLNVAWLDLLGGEFGLSSVELSGPAIRVVRNEDESINLVELFTPPTDDADEPEQESAETGEPMPVRIDHFELQRGRLVFDDRTLADAEPLALEIGPLIVDDFSWPLPSQGHDADLELDVTSDGGVLNLRAHASDVDGAMSITATVDAENLRMVNMRGYTGTLGWVDLRGFLDVHLTYERVGAQVHGVKGDVELRGMAVALPDVDRVPLLIERLALTGVDVDLVGQRASLGELVLNGGSLTADPRYGPILPVIIGVEPDDASAGAEEEQTEEEKLEAQTPDDAAVEEGAPWSWSVGKLAVTDLLIRVLTQKEPITLTVAIDASDIDSDTGDIFPVSVAIVDGDASLNGDGRVRIDPPGASLVLAWKSLDLARLATAVPFDDARMLRAGTSSGELRIGADLAPPSDDAAALSDGAGDVLVSGRVSLDGFDVDLNPALAAQANWRRIDTEIASVLVPSVLGDDAAKANAGPIMIRLAKLTIDEPRLDLVLDGAETADTAAKTEVGMDSGADTATENDSATDESGGAAALVGIAIENFDLRGARVRIEERNGNTPFSGTLTAEHVKSALITWPDVNARALEARGGIFEAGEWSIDGSIEDADGRLTILLQHVPLPPLSALSDDAAGLNIGRGTLSLDTKLQLSGDSVDSNNRVTAHELELSGERANELFSANFGMPLSVVIALLKDPGGDISLDLPVSASRGQTSTGIGTAVTAVLREAVVGAVTSPLKLLGSVAVLGGKVAGFSLDPVEFAPGSAVFSAESAAELDGLAAMVKSRPELVLELRGVIVDADVRRMKERALLETFETDTPLGDAVPELSWFERRRLRSYLESAKAGEQATLEGDDETLLSAVLAAMPTPTSELSGLAAARVAKLQAILQQAHGLSAAQLAVAGEIEAPAVSTGVARVEFSFAAAGD